MAKRSPLRFTFRKGWVPGVVLADLAGEGLAAKGSVAIHIAAIHAGGNNAAVKQHGSGFLVQIGTGPYSSADAVALVGGGVGAGGGHAGAKRVQLLHHVGGLPGKPPQASSTPLLAL